MTKKKKIFLLLAILSLFICIYTTSKTYAKYFSQPNNERKYYIKRWNININDENVKNNQELTNKININIDKLNDVADDKLAPNSTGSFEINMDYTNTDLNFDYEIEIIENEELKDLVIYKTEINDNVESLTNIDNKITKHININDEPKKQNIKIFLKWIDDETNSMTNQEDTDFSKKYTNITLDVKIKLTQQN